MEFLKNTAINDRYSKYYSSTKNESETLFFAIAFETHVFSDSKKNIDLTINIEVSYIGSEFNKSKLHYFVPATHHGKDNISFAFNGGSFRVVDLIVSKKSYGIGSLILNEAFMIAKKYIPDEGAKFSLSSVDEVDVVNKNRRDKMYKKFGLLKNEDDNCFFIEKISNINTFKENSSINEIDCADFIKESSKIQAWYKTLQSSSSQKDMQIKNLQAKTEEIRDKSTSRISACIILVLPVVIFTYAYFSIFKG